MIASILAGLGTKIASWIEAAYVLDCADPEIEAGQDWTWLPALSGVTVASAQAIQSHSGKARIDA
ncbi:hypothetical protein ACIQC5_20910 [Paenarthrobacter sp. NPDC092416]|uniref:hypothetical protein n=1 Tax=Paenarthrobacter sp. NPDC092416 TaxID=3364386 RepID=UPI003804A690